VSYRKLRLIIFPALSTASAAAVGFAFGSTTDAIALTFIVALLAGISVTAGFLLAHSNREAPAFLTPSRLAFLACAVFVLTAGGYALTGGRTQGLALAVVLPAAIAAFVVALLWRRRGAPANNR
jgi:hypothetical protein